MEETKLFSSLALFRELYDNDKDIYDLIAEFIISVISHKKIWSFNSTDITNILKDFFELDIPEAVIKTTLRNRLVKKGKLEYKSGVYNVVLSSDIKDDFTERIKTTNQQYQQLIDDLILYVGKKWGKELNEKEKEEITNNFYSYIIDNGISDKYAGVISSFILEKKNNKYFTNIINKIKEGLIIYNGVKYTSNLNELGTWNYNLSIYLDTEHLFNAIGYNGILYKQIFDDFYNLVTEINRKNRSKNFKIELKYFIETKNEVDNFFYVAELITKKEATLDPSKSAMVAILNGCNSPSEIINKKSSFFKQLKDLGISLDTNEYHIIEKYNVVDENIVNELKKYSEEKNKNFDEDEVYQILRIFTKINTIRHGVSNSGFDKIKAIFMSGNSLTHFLAHNKKIKFNEKDIPFATDIDFITNKFWFKLKKGLSNNKYLPRTFDIVTKAQVVLANQIKNSVSVKYSKIKEDYNQGKISKEEAEYNYHELRTKIKLPEEITPDIIDSSLSFISTDGYEDFLREKSLLEQELRKGKDAIERLNKIEKEKYNNNKNKIKKSINRRFKITIIVINIILFILLISISIGVYSIFSPSDTLISRISFIFTIGVWIFGYWKYYKRFISKIWRKYKSKYKSQLLDLKITNAQQKI